MFVAITITFQTIWITCFSLHVMSVVKWLIKQAINPHKNNIKLAKPNKLPTVKTLLVINWAFLLLLTALVMYNPKKEDMDRNIQAVEFQGTTIQHTTQEYQQHHILHSNASLDHQYNNPKHMKILMSQILLHMQLQTLDKQDPQELT